jgi:hypothetical protein
MQSTPAQRKVSHQFSGDIEAGQGTGGVHLFASVVKDRIRKKRNPEMHKEFSLLIGMFLLCRVSEAAQTAGPQIVLVKEHIAPVMTMLHPVSIPLPGASLLGNQNPRETPAHFSLLLSGAYEPDHSLEHLSPMDKVKTLTLTQSSLPLFQLWGGRLQLDAFQSTLHSQNVQLGVLGYGGMEGFCPSRQSYPGGPLSVHFSGLSLSFHFDRDSRARRPTQVWRRLTRSVGTLLN